MNNIAISNHVFLYALQNQNIDRKIAKTIDISNLSSNDNKKESTKVTFDNTVENTFTEKIENNSIPVESSNIEDLPTSNIGSDI